jgi:thiol-disulfide isomerase/thioredoxin
LQGVDLTAIESLKITKGPENMAFETYAKDHPKREQALSAWLYLEKIYTADSLFSVKKAAVQAIATEKKRIHAEDAAFIANLPKTSYVKWFLPLRKMVSSVSTVAQYRTEEIPVTVAAFRNLDFTDARFYKSGLYQDAIDSHFWLLENSGNDFDTMYKEMQTSIDAMLLNLVKDIAKLNEVTNHLFNLLEKRSLFIASEYLAVKVLNEDSCVLERDLAMQLETYRAMKKGNIAPEIVFDKASFAKPSQAITKLSDVKSTYTLVTFAASWCPKCTEELPLLANYYNNWKAKGVEVLFIGLEDNRKSFTDFAASFPFPAYSDLKKWESKSVKDYYVFGTPTMFLLNEKREIVLRPTSVEQVNSWVLSYL